MSMLGRRGLQVHMLVELVAEPDIIPAWDPPGQQLLQRASVTWAADLRRLKLNKARALPCVLLHVCFEQLCASPRPTLADSVKATVAASP